MTTQEYTSPQRVVAPGAVFVEHRTKRPRMSESAYIAPTAVRRTSDGRGQNRVQHLVPRAAHDRPSGGARMLVRPVRRPVGYVHFERCPTDASGQTAEVVPTGRADTSGGSEQEEFLRRGTAPSLPAARSRWTETLPLVLRRLPERGPAPSVVILANGRDAGGRASV